MATGQTFYNSESQLSPSYTRPYSQHYWNGASFNDSRRKELAFFYIAVSSDNQSQGPIGMTVSFGPNVPGGTSYVPLYIDSFQLTFSSVTFGSFPDVAVRSYSAQGGLSPTRISGVNGQAVVSYHRLGFLGEGN